MKKETTVHLALRIFLIPFLFAVVYCSANYNKHQSSTNSFVYATITTLALTFLFLLIKGVVLFYQNKREKAKMNFAALAVILCILVFFFV